jgi:Na+/phosphate symporter
MGERWILAILTFLFVLCRYKYEKVDELKEQLLEYLAGVSHEPVEEEDLVELEEVRDMVLDFIVENHEIFSKIKVKNG